MTEGVSLHHLFPENNQVLWSADPEPEAQNEETIRPTYQTKQYGEQNE